MWLNLLPWELQLPTFLLITCPIISPLRKEKSWRCTSHIHQHYREQSSRNSRLTKYFQIFGQWSPGLLTRTFFFVMHDSEIHQFSVSFPLLSHLLYHKQLTCPFPFSPRVFLPTESKVSHHSLPLVSYHWFPVTMQTVVRYSSCIVLHEGWIVQGGPWPLVFCDSFYKTTV